MIYLLFSITDDCSFRSYVLFFCAFILYSKTKIINMFFFNLIYIYIWLLLLKEELKGEGDGAKCDFQVCDRVREHSNSTYIHMCTSFFSFSLVSSSLIFLLSRSSPFIFLLHIYDIRSSIHIQAILSSSMRIIEILLFFCCSTFSFTIAQFEKKIHDVIFFV